MLAAAAITVHTGSTTARRTATSASDPYVLACGGTTLQVNPTRPWTRSCGTTGVRVGEGGGISDRFPMPSWQAAKGVRSASTTTQRGSRRPGRAGDADPHTAGRWSSTGSGESKAERARGSVYAGLIALLNESPGSRWLDQPFIYSLYETKHRRHLQGEERDLPAPGYSATRAGTPGLAWRIDGKNLLTGLE